MNDTSNTTNAASQSDIPQSVSDFMRHITDLCGGEHARWAENFNAGFANTLTTTVRRHDDGTTFLLTGDIPAMWLRDSSAQFRPYLAVAVDDPELTALITGLVRQQFRFINIDPYANAFNDKNLIYRVNTDILRCDILKINIVYACTVIHIQSHTRRCNNVCQLILRMCVKQIRII